MPSFHNGFRLFALGLLCGAFAGCGTSNVVNVSGKLTYKAQPVTNAIIHFVPQSGGRPSMAETDAQGKFVLTYDPETKGAERGKHKVFVQHNALADQSKPGAIPGMPVSLPPDQKTFFEKYSGDNSKVEVTIDRANNDLKLDWD